MKILITPTDTLTKIEEAPVRLWNGVTDKGAECKVFVRLIAVVTSENMEAFDRELKEQLPPGTVIPLRQVL